jgi:hypothetical protein
MPFLYKDRQKREVESVNEVVSTPDYSKTEQIPEPGENRKGIKQNS